MAAPKTDIKDTGRQAKSSSTNYSLMGRRPEGVKKKQLLGHVRKSPRLNKTSPIWKPTISGDEDAEPKSPFPPSIGDAPVRKFPQSSFLPPPAEGRKRKRSRGNTDSYVSTTHNKKRLRTSLASPAAANTPHKDAAHCVGNNEAHVIDHWREKGTWPKEYFEQDDQTREYFNRDLEEESWLREYWTPNMEHVLARKKSSPSLRGKQSEFGSVERNSTPSDQKPREEKSATYNTPRYETLLKTKGIYMDKSDLDITVASKTIYQSLLESEQTVLQDSLFHDDLFEDTCRMIRNKNEARVIRDISLLIVPSAETLSIRGVNHLRILIESVNEGWNSSIPVTKPRPQPDYSVGFKREAFTEDQLSRLRPLVGDVIDNYTSFFMATYYMYFPFLTCEVKCGAAALDVADRQNAHSMTIAVRAVVELFRLIGREREVNREILAFSISHDHRTVRIYGHYPVVNGKDTKFYRHPIREFSFIELDGRDKWTAYKFTKSVYNIWMPTHFKRICSAVDQIPCDVNFEVSELDLPLSQRSNASARSLSEGDGSQASFIGSADVTPNTSFTQPTENVFKRPRKKK